MCQPLAGIPPRAKRALRVPLGLWAFEARDGGFEEGACPLGINADLHDFTVKPEEPFVLHRIGEVVDEIREVGNVQPL